jgi:hypothetical protein
MSPQDKACTVPYLTHLGMYPLGRRHRLPGPLKAVLDQGGSLYTVSLHLQHVSLLGMHCTHSSQRWE